MYLFDYKLLISIILGVIVAFYFDWIYSLMDGSILIGLLGIVVSGLVGIVVSYIIIFKISKNNKEVMTPMFSIYLVSFIITFIILTFI